MRNFLYVGRAALDTLGASRRIVLLLMLAYPFISSNAQSFKEDIKKMYASYTSFSQLSFTIKMEVYSSQNGGEMIDRQEFKVRRLKNNFAYDYGSIQMIHNEKNTVLINENERVVVVNEHQNKNKSSLNFLSEQIDSILAQVNTVEFIRAEKRGLHYRIVNPGQIIAETNIWLDPQYYLFKRIEYYYNTDLFPENNKVVLKFEDINPMPFLTKSKFYTDKYFTKTAKGYSLTKPYANYKLIVN